jgi:cytochrome c-type biogenesis protein CcmE
MKIKAKFVFGFVLVVAPLAWLAVSGFEESKAYYVTVSEVEELGPRAIDRRLKVAGHVVPGSIERRDGALYFQLEEPGSVLDCVYLGRDPVPDTFVDEAQAVAEGILSEDGVFRAQRLQAKCASKYEAAYGEGTTSE